MGERDRELRREQGGGDQKMGSRRKKKDKGKGEKKEKKCKTKQNKLRRRESKV